MASVKDNITPTPTSLHDVPLTTTPVMASLALDEPPHSRPRTTLRIAAILIALYLALFIAALDQTITATAVPTITAQLHSASGYFWVGGAYLLANAAAGPIWAKTSDIWGRKPALLGSVALFAAGSVVAAVSSSMRMLIAGRALQGVAGGGLIQLVIITLSDLFSVRERTLYIGLVEVVWAVAGGAGPLIGGAFTEIDWRWCFWINLPISGTAFGLLLLFLDVHNPKTSIRDGLMAIDWFGTLSIVAVTLMLLLGLDFGGATFPWSSPTVICLIVFGLVAVGIFLFSEQRLARYPLMPLAIFRDRSTAAAMFLAASHGMVFIAAAYYIPLYLQSAKQATPLRSGVLVLPVLITEATLGISMGLVMHRTGKYRGIIWAGMMLLTLGSGLFIMFSRTTSIAQIVGFQLLFGCGSGMLFEAPLIAVQAMAKQAHTATATATFGFVRTMSCAISIVIGGVVFQNGMDHKAIQLQSAGLNSTIIDALSGGNAAANVELIGQITNIAQMHAVEDAFAGSLQSMWIVYTCIAGAGLVVSLFLVHNPLSTEHTETKTGLPSDHDGQ